MQIALLRHLQSQGNVDPTAYSTYGDQGVPLSEAGKAQAPATGAALDRLCEQFGIQSLDEICILTSPFVRARQTIDLSLQHAATPLLRQHAPSIIEEKEWLREIDTGKAMGLTRDESYTLYPRNTEVIRNTLQANPETGENNSRDPSSRNREVT